VLHPSVSPLSVIRTIRLAVRSFRTSSSGVLRAAAARPSSAAGPRTAGAPALQRLPAARPHRPVDAARRAPGRFPPANYPAHQRSRRGSDKGSPKGRAERARSVPWRVRAAQLPV